MDASQGHRVKYINTTVIKFVIHDFNRVPVFIEAD